MMKTMDPGNFNPNKRAYPFEDGEVAPWVSVRLEGKEVIFTGQRGPIKEVSVNGCQIDDMIAFARKTIEIFNAKFPCRENSLAITKLQEAEHWLLARRRDREVRGVEGRSER